MSCQFSLRLSLKQFVLIVNCVYGSVRVVDDGFTLQANNCIVISLYFWRGHFVNALSQWETTWHCNVVSHWQDAYTKWSLLLVWRVSMVSYSPFRIFTYHCGNYLRINFNCVRLFIVRFAKSWQLRCTYFCWFYQCHALCSTLWKGIPSSL